MWHYLWRRLACGAAGGAAVGYLVSIFLGCLPALARTGVILGIAAILATWLHARGNQVDKARDAVKRLLQAWQARAGLLKHEMAKFAVVHGRFRLTQDALLFEAHAVQWVPITTAGIVVASALPTLWWAPVVGFALAGAFAVAVDGDLRIVDQAEAALQELDENLPTK